MIKMSLLVLDSGLGWNLHWLQRLRLCRMQPSLQPRLQDINRITLPTIPSLPERFYGMVIMNSSLGCIGSTKCSPPTFICWQITTELTSHSLKAKVDVFGLWRLEKQDKPSKKAAFGLQPDCPRSVLSVTFPYKLVNCLTLTLIEW